jgi:hypothetical protein
VFLIKKEDIIKKVKNKEIKSLLLIKLAVVACLFVFCLR